MLLNVDSDRGEDGPTPPVSRTESANSESPELLEIEEKLEDVITTENKTALFECKVVMDHHPTCTWQKNGIQLKNYLRTSISSDGPWQRLEIKHVQLCDQGVYTIDVRHNDRYVSVKAHLYVAPALINNGVYYHTRMYICCASEIVRHINNTKVIQGETINMIAKFRSESETYFWYKNNEPVLHDRRVTLTHHPKMAIITITNAEPTDVGIYYVVKKTEQGYWSSFTDVLVGSRQEKRQPVPTIEEHLPDESEAIVGEEHRMIIKFHADVGNLTIQWFRNNEPLTSNDMVELEDYGHNYIGLTIPKAVQSSAGNYKVTITSLTSQRAIEEATNLTVVLPPQSVPDVKVARPLESAVACCGAKVTFDCSFDLKDPIYFYVVWYVGHYRVERTNSLFTVICGCGQFILYINRIEPSMAGKVICELRRSWPNRKSVMVQRAYASLVIVPPCVIEEARRQPELKSKIFYEKDIEDIDIRVEENVTIASESYDVADRYDDNYLLMITFTRLDNNGLYFVHAKRGASTQRSAKSQLAVYETSDTSVRITCVSWNSFLGPEDCWFRIELAQQNGSYIEAGCTSRAMFEIESLPLDRLLVFRISAMEPLSRTFDSEIYIVPPPEVILRLPRPIEISSLEDFQSQYKKTNEKIGAGAFGSVVLVRDIEGNGQYAAKFVKSRIGKKKEKIFREFHIMKNLRHPKLIQLLGFFDLRFCYVFVMEYCWGGELFDRVVGDEFLQEMDVVGYVKQICEALEYMHSKGYVHMDLKPENIICINPNSRLVKLIDFGLSRNVNEDVSRAIYGTRDYIAPEVIDFEPISTYSDMWSLGVVTYMLLSGVMPFAGDGWLNRSANITGVRYDYLDASFNEVSDLGKRFVDGLLVRKPHDRMSATEALHHVWLKEGPPTSQKAKNMTKMRKNMKTYLVEYRQRWQRVGNMMIAAHRLRRRNRVEEPSNEPPTPARCPEHEVEK